MNCLARLPQILPIQTIPLDERNWIGVVDLGLCLQAIAQGSPELVGDLEHDFTVYAFDYSEPDTPLVGQGMLSRALESVASPDDKKMVTGRVTKNHLAIFGNGIRETLEVKLRLKAVPKMRRAQSSGTPEASASASTPTDAMEWNSFIQSNPALGRSASVAAILSPAMAPPLVADLRPASRQPTPSMSQHLELGGRDTAAAPVPDTAPREIAPKPSRPSSRASRSKAPTGRPRGRPRKRPYCRRETPRPPRSSPPMPTTPRSESAPRRPRLSTRPRRWTLPPRASASPPARPAPSEQ